MQLLIITITWIVSSNVKALQKEYVRACTHDFYCNEEYLKIIGKHKIFKDSKYVVDLDLKDDFENIRTDFHNRITAENLTAGELKELLKEYFVENTYLVEGIPNDWVESPAFVDNIKDPKLRDWALELHKIWPRLYRKVDLSKFNERRTSFIQIPNATIIPGGRFKETYYWDSYFVILGLLVSDMPQTVKAVILNMLHFVKLFGHVPNGGRIYYIERSQPPFLSLMVYEYLKYTNDTAFLNENIHILDKEYEFWLRNRSQPVKNFKPFLYRTNTGFPRPESCIEDIHTAQRAKELLNRKECDVYVSLSSGAESGWDFSSRWFRRCGNHSHSIISIQTDHIIPVCLNSILCKVAQVLMEFHEWRRNETMRDFYKSEVERLRNLLHDLMWNNETQQWNDYDYINHSKNPSFYHSNYFPLWANCHKLTSAEKELLLQRMIASNVLSLPGGFPTSTFYSAEQWDHPAAWPPLQYIMVEGLLNINSTTATNLAYELARKWIVNNFETYVNENKTMFEKYNAIQTGRPGYGGEYIVQDGFGWSNGVALRFLSMYSDMMISQNKTDVILHQRTFIILLELVILGHICLFAAIIFRRYKLASK